MPQNNKVTNSLIILAFLAFSTTAYAYIPPSFFIYKQIAKKHTDLKNVVIKSKVQFLSSSQGQRGPALVEYIYVSEASHITTQLKTSKDHLVLQTSRSLSSNSEKVSHLYDILLGSDFDRSLRNARVAGLSVKSESNLYHGRKGTEEVGLPYIAEEAVQMAKEGNRIFFVISAEKDRYNEAPALWVEKNSFLPHKVFLKGPSSEEYHAFFSHYSIHQGSFYPRNILVYLDHEPWVKIELIEIKNSSVKHPASGQGIQIFDNDTGLERDIALYSKLIR
jgi:hypothetical protein